MGMGKGSLIFKRNLSCLMERFPKLAFLTPAGSIPTLPKEPSFSIDPGPIEAFYVYGLGRGVSYLPLYSWLQEKKERRVIFLEDQLDRLAAWLLDPQTTRILTHEQVHIAFGTSQDDLQALAEQFPLQAIDVMALPSKKGARFRRLRMQLLSKTTLARALYLDRLHGHQPLHNFLRNLCHLPSSFYANRLQGAFSQIPAIVCGAGPSLTDVTIELQHLPHRSLIIAGGSAIAALSSRGIIPHFGIAIDPNVEEYQRMRNSFAFEMPLLYSTRVFPAIFQTCNGPFGYMRSGIGGMAEIWLEEELGLFDPLLGQHLAEESISVTAICAAWAQFLGCNPIIFCGVDLAYTGKKHYVSGVLGVDAAPIPPQEKEPTTADQMLKRKDRKGQLVDTKVLWVMEAASLSHFAKKHPEVQFFHGTQGGLPCQGIPFLPLKDAIDRYHPPDRDLYDLVAQKIAMAPMPAHTAEVTRKLIQELKES